MNETPWQARFSAISPRRISPSIRAILGVLMFCAFLWLGHLDRGDEWTTVGLVTGAVVMTLFAVNILWGSWVLRVSSILVVAVIVWFRVIDDDPQDLLNVYSSIMLWAGVSSGLAVFVMYVTTKRWDALEVGLLFTFLGVLLYTANSAVLGFGWWELSMDYTAWLNNVIIALLAVGSTWTVVGISAGLIGWTRSGVQRWRMKRKGEA